MPDKFLDPTIITTKIGTIEIDASLAEDHKYSASLTENPVEDGTVFTDHIVLLPVVLEMEGRISDASQHTFDFRTGRKSIDAFQGLVALQKTKQLFNVITRLHVYKNMMFRELSVPREALDGRSVRFNATLQEILVVGDNVETNRDRIADEVKNTALPSVSKGIVDKVPV